MTPCYFIFNDFYTCFSNFFYPGLALTVARGEMPYVVYRALHVHLYVHVRTRMCSVPEVVTCTCNQR